MDKWNILSLFILSVGLFEMSGKQLLNMERGLERNVDLTTLQYNFWLMVNLASIALGLSMLHKLRKLSVTVDLSMEQPKKHRKRNVEEQ